MKTHLAQVYNNSTNYMTLTNQNKLKSVINYFIKQKSNVFTLFFLFFGLSATLYSQNVSTFSPKINIPSSPEAALLGRFGDIPIGYNTGTANISIPIYTIKEAGIEIPIQLRYHSSGIKVSDEATWVGLGWDLSPAGSIIQEVRGKRDDMDMFYSVVPQNYSHVKNIILNYGYQGSYKHLRHRCYASPESDNLYPLPNGTFPFDVKNLIEQGGAQPDIYQFNFGGHSGSFYIDFETKQVIQLNKTEDIVFDMTNMTAKTSDGITYTFGVSEQAFNTDTEPDQVDRVGRTYWLSSITLVNGNKIDFTYINASSANLSFQERYLITETCSGENQNAKGLRNRIVQNDIKILSKITTNTTVIDFILEDREDIVPITAPTALPSPKRLKAIDISYRGLTNKKIKTFELGYSYFPYDEFLGNPSVSSSLSFYNTNKARLGKRLKLDTVKEIGYDNLGNQDRTMPTYKLEYDLSSTMPMKISFAKDFWGYFNGIDNKTLLPDLIYFDYEYQMQYYQPDYVSGYRVNYQVPFKYGYYQGINRYTDNEKAGTYMLKKISYPTGGFSQFEYEPNSFSNQFIPDMAELGKAYKPKSLTSFGKSTDVYHHDFKLANATTISFTNVINDGYTPFPNPNAPVYSYDNFNPGNNASRIVFSKTKQGVTTIIKQWKVTDELRVAFESNHGKTWNESLRIDYDPDPTVIYAVDIINTLQYSASDTYRIAGLKSDFRYYDDTGVTKVSKTGGLRVKTIKNYSSTGNIANKKNLKYSGGRILTRFQPLSTQETFCEVREPDAVNGQLVTTATVSNEISISSDNLFTSDGGLVAYENIEETEVDNNDLTNGKKVYTYYNYENISGKNFPTVLNYFNGLLSFEASYDKNDTLLFQKSYSYQSVSPDQYSFGIININQLRGLSSSCNDMLYPGMTDFTFVSYPLISSNVKLVGSNTRSYFNGSAVSVDETLTYDSDLNIKTSTNKTSNDDQFTTNSDKLVTTYYYSKERPQLDPIEDIMTNAKMTGIPIVTENRKNMELLSRQNTQYAKDVTTNNWILPKYIFAGKGANSSTYSFPEKKVTYDKYDSKANIQQYTLENGTPVTILWGYKQTQPIAKIENASYANVATALGITTAVLDTYNEDQLASINTLRGLLPNAMVSTFSYIPLIGVSTITDPKNDKITYMYDPFGRLINVKDKNDNILSENKYQYKN